MSAHLTMGQHGNCPNCICIHMVLLLCVLKMYYVEVWVFQKFMTMLGLKVNQFQILGTDVFSPYSYLLNFPG